MVMAFAVQRLLTQANPARIEKARAVVLPLVAAVVLGSFGWQYLSQRAPADGAMVVQGVDVGRQSAALHQAITATIDGIRDAASADASLPKLRAHAAALLDIRDMAETLPADARQQLAARVAPWLPKVEALCLTALGSPGVEAVAKPVLAQIVERLKALTKG